uniref:Ribosome biogenesis protein BOP1 homolog n=1 Tax=Caenorhabditis tropicalis TaxID=1561998 RepID=A0A1I7TCH4_9PELO
MASTSAKIPQPAKRKLENGKKKPKTKLKDEFGEKLDIKPVIPKPVDEYDYDSSDEEDLRNTIGNIPIKWYDDEEHIGYDKSGEKIIKPAKKGEIETFLEKMEDPDYWRKVFDKQTGADIKLTDEQIEKIHNIASGKYPTIGYNPYEPFLDIFSSQKEIHPIDNRPEPKARFIPSKDEMRMVSRMVHAIKMGWAKGPKTKKEEPKVYDLWAAEDALDNVTKSQLSRMRVHMPAPKVALPTHAESYNPPEEYLFDDEERKKWEETDKDDRVINFMPSKYDALRKVPQYDKFITERFERCLDLYLAPRQRKMRIHADPTDLLPDLPNPNDLRPFPTTLAFYMRGHSGQVRTISVEPERGELLASGGEDGTVRIWMIATGRCIKTFQMDGEVTSVAFCPVADRTLLAVAYEGKYVSILNTGCGDRLHVQQTETLLAETPTESQEDGAVVTWRKSKDRLVLKMPNEVRQVTWHAKGDYFASVSIDDIAKSVYVHQMSKAKSQCPFQKRKGHVQAVAFHPTQARLFVATKIHVREYDLARCVLVKKLITGCKHISSMATDANGENLFLGGLDRRFCWMDLQMGNKPWKKLKHHTAAVRSVAYHKKYPLLATVSDDGTAMVYYARIYLDFSKDNELYPVKRLRAHERTSNDLCMLHTTWHPTQPWLITAGADGTIALFTY